VRKEKKERVSVRRTIVFVQTRREKKELCLSKKERTKITRESGEIVSMILGIHPFVFSLTKALTSFTQRDASD
jgi:hypothetical protein